MLSEDSRDSTYSQYKTKAKLIAFISDDEIVKAIAKLEGLRQLVMIVRRHAKSANVMSPACQLLWRLTKSCKLGDLL